MKGEDLEDLIDFRVAHEQRLLFDKLSENTSNRPHVDWKGVLLLSKENFRCSIPESFNLVSERLDWHAECSRKTEVSEFDNASLINKEILRF